MKKELKKCDNVSLDIKRAAFDVEICLHRLSLLLRMEKLNKEIKNL